MMNIIQKRTSQARARSGRARVRISTLAGHKWVSGGSDRSLIKIPSTTLEGLENQNKSFIFKNTLLFALGFSIVFISLGATATFLGSILFNYSKFFTYLVGLIIIILSFPLVH